MHLHTLDTDKNEPLRNDIRLLLIKSLRGK